MALVQYTLDESVAIMTLNSGENRFNPTFLNAVLDTLDTIETDTAATTLLVSSTHEKIFSNGIDLDWLVPLIQKKNIEGAKDFFNLLNRVFKRVLTYPLLTVAAINGHAFAGGALLCCAFDFRFMRTDRGYFCLPEVDLGIPFLPGMNMLLKKAIPMYKVEEMQFTGCRLTADQCLEHHIVSGACARDDLMPTALAFAKTLNKKRGIVAEMKKRLYTDVLHAIDVQDVPYIESGDFHIG